MIKNRVLGQIGIYLIFFMPLCASAQEVGIQFESALSWREIQAKAKAENKLIFMDCYATWCGPCKWMTKNIFPQQEVGAYFNSHFVCVAVQLDKTLNDGQAIKDWYSDADIIKKEYKIQDYPTYLFFSSDGKIVHRVIGATTDGIAFIAKAREALDTSTQYYTQISQWEKHKNDTMYLWKIYSDAKHMSDNEQAKAIAEVFLDNQKDLFTRRNLQLILRSGQLRSSQSKWFKFYIDNQARIDDSLGIDGGIKNFVAWVLTPTVFREEVTPLFSQHKPIYWRSVRRILQEKYSKLGKELEDNVNEEFGYQIGQEIKRAAYKSADSRPDWAQIGDSIGQKFPDYDFHKVLLETKIKYCLQKKLWTECETTAYTLIHKYGKRINHIDMNGIVWDCIFLHSDDPKILTSGIKEMKYIIEKRGDSNDAYLDTYANLLYKVHQRGRALTIQTRIVESALKDHAPSEDLKTWQDNLDKMRRGMPTWEENVPAS